VPFGSEVVVMTGGATTVSVKFWLAVLEALSVTCTVKAALAVALGVPEISPEEEFNDSGAGKDPLVIAHETYGGTPPAAANV
jgi:hypothetical protein